MAIAMVRLGLWQEPTAIIVQMKKHDRISVVLF
jgi:hypothetical protein